jgi:predicted SAM-dependent methyltransferase
MISRTLKEAYFQIMRYPMMMNGALYKAFRAPRSGKLCVHLGPGQKNYLPKWVNVDANLFTAKTDVWADLKNSLPFHTNSVDVFYSHHVIEHLPDSFLSYHFSEMFRCLKPGGFVRVGGPNGDSAIRKFQEGDLDWFGDFPDKRESIGGRFANFILCRGEHLTILTYSYMHEIAQNAGFSGILQCNPTTQTFHPAFIDESVLAKEWESAPEVPHTLIIEAEKPLSCNS